VEPPRQLLRTISAKVASIAAAEAQAQVVAVRPVRRPFSWRVAGSLAGACLALVAIIFVGVHGRPGAPIAPAIAPPAATESAAAVPAPTPPVPATTESATLATLPKPGAPQPAQAAIRTSPVPRILPQRGETKSMSPPAPATRNLVVPSGPFHMTGEGPQATSFGLEAPAPTRPRAVGVDIRVTPPAERQVETWGTVTISITPQGNVGRARVRVVGGDALEVSREQVYVGPLSAGAAKQVTARVRAHAPGAHALHVIVTSDTPVVDTDLPVKIGGYYAAARSGQTYRQFHSVTLSEAAQAVAGDGGLCVEISPLLAGRRITADFSAGLSAHAALRLLAQMTDATLEKTDGGYRLDPR